MASNLIGIIHPRDRNQTSTNPACRAGGQVQIFRGPECSENEPINPAMVSFVTASVAKDAPHPNAGKLLLDFLASDEGQALYRDNGYPPANPKLQTMYKDLIPDGQKFRAQFFTPEQVDAGLPGWVKEYKELFD